MLSKRKKGTPRSSAFQGVGRVLGTGQVVEATSGCKKKREDEDKDFIPSSEEDLTPLSPNSEIIRRRRNLPSLEITNFLPPLNDSDPASDSELDHDRHKRRKTNTGEAKSIEMRDEFENKEVETRIGGADSGAKANIEANSGVIATRKPRKSMMMMFTIEKLKKRALTDPHVAEYLREAGPDDLDKHPKPARSSRNSKKRGGNKYGEEKALDKSHDGYDWMLESDSEDGTDFEEGSDRESLKTGGRKGVEKIGGSEE